MLLPYSEFDSLFKPIKDKKVFFSEAFGWTGDSLIVASIRQLFKHYNVTECSVEDCDWIVESGGGNLGNRYKDSYLKRQRLIGLAEKHGKKIIIMPKSFYGDTQELPDCIHRVYAREIITKSMIPKCILAPDTALAFTNFENVGKPKYDFGLFIRNDENLFNSSDYPYNIGDPRALIRFGIPEMFDLASNYETICTDRLHFAITGMLLKRKVILLPNSYFKNYGMYITWLSKLGCEWKHTPEEFKDRIPKLLKSEPIKIDVSDSLWHYGRGPDYLFGMVKLKKDGSISFYDNKNEKFWKQNSDGSLDFLNGSKEITTHFPKEKLMNGEWRGNYNGLQNNHYLRISNVRLYDDYQ